MSADFQTGLAEFNGEPNHLRLLVNLPPRTALSRLVNSPNAPRRIRQQFPDLQQHYCRASRL